MDTVRVKMAAHAVQHFSEGHGLEVFGVRLSKPGPSMAVAAPARLGSYNDDVAPPLKRDVPLPGYLASDQLRGLITKGSVEDIGNAARNVMEFEGVRLVASQAPVLSARSAVVDRYQHDDPVAKSVSETLPRLGQALDVANKLHGDSADKRQELGQTQGGLVNHYGKVAGERACDLSLAHRLTLAPNGPAPAAQAQAQAVADAEFDSPMVPRP